MYGGRKEKEMYWICIKNEPYTMPSCSPQFRGITAVKHLYSTLMTSVVNHHHTWDSREITEEASESSWTATPRSSLSCYYAVKHWNWGKFLPTANTQIKKKSLTHPGGRDDREGEERQVRKTETDGGEKVCMCMCECVHEDRWGFVERNHSQLHLYSSLYRPTEIRAVVC